MIGVKNENDLIPLFRYFLDTVKEILMKNMKRDLYYKYMLVILYELNKIIKNF